MPAPEGHPEWVCSHCSTPHTDERFAAEHAFHWQGHYQSSSPCFASETVLTCRGLASLWRRTVLELGLKCYVLPRHMAQESRIERVETVHKTPIMFYRPNQPSGGNYLKVPGPIPTSSKAAAHTHGEP